MLRSSRIDRRLFLSFLASQSLMLGCAPFARIAAKEGRADLYFSPDQGNEWQAVDPAEDRWDKRALEVAARYGKDQASTALLVLDRGRLAYEGYWRGWQRHSRARIFSATKSMVSFLIGVAESQGKLEIEDPVSAYLGRGWSRATPSQERRIKIRHALSMTSGLDRRLRFMAPAGDDWFYLSGTYYKLFDLLEVAYGERRQDIFERELFAKIGMRDTRFPVGRFSVRLSASARDLARFGLLILSRGLWHGRAILPYEGFLRASLSSSQRLNPAYGYLWWLNGKPFSLDVIDARRREGALLPSAPADTVAAVGHGAVAIVVIPSRALVIVRHGTKPDDDTLDFLDKLTSKVLAAQT